MNCAECAAPLPVDLDYWLSGPDEIRWQGMYYPGPCPNEWCPSNQPQRTGYVVRGKEDRVTESGIYVIREPEDET
jgi:hypothetical protein